MSELQRPAAETHLMPTHPRFTFSEGQSLDDLPVVELPELGSRCLLAIDTSMGTSVALARGGGVRELHSDDPRGHTEEIGGMIASLFTLPEAAAADVQGVVVGIGPGPFTGLRVGIAAAKAFAVGRGVPLLPILGHEAVALRAFEQAPQPAAVVDGDFGPRVLQDARRREIFVTEYSGLDDAGLPVRSADPRLLAHADYLQQPGDVWPERVSAAGLAQLAARRLSAGRNFEPDRAVYLRAPDAKPAAAIKRVSA